MFILLLVSTGTTRRKSECYPSPSFYYRWWKPWDKTSYSGATRSVDIKPFFAPSLFPVEIYFCKSILTLIKPPYTVVHCTEKQRKITNTAKLSY